MRLINAGICFAVALVAAASAIAGNRIECPDPTMATCEGTTGDDILVGTPKFDFMEAKAGNDTLLGKRGIDELRGEEDNDTLNGGRGADSYSFYGSAWGQDRIEGDRRGSGNALVFFPAGTDAVDVELKPKQGVPEVFVQDTVVVNTINIAKGTRFARVQTSEGADTIRGTSAGEQLGGADQGDRIVGRGGADVLIGDFDVFSDVGDDTLIGGPGKDQFTGGPGADTIKAKDGQRDRINCGDGVDLVTYDKGRDKLAGDGSCEV